MNCNQNCKNCPKPNRKAVPPSGPENANLMVIGECPGQHETREMEPFVGKSGKLLRQALQEECNINPQNVYMTTTVKCRPDYNKTPEGDAIRACNNRLEKEINQVEPDLILTLGSTASRTVLDSSKGIWSLRGKFYQRYGTTVLLTIKPGNCLAEPTTYRDFQEDIRRIPKLIDEPFDLELDTDYLVAKKPQQGIKFLKELSEYDRIGADLETYGTDQRKDDIFTMGLSHKFNQSVVFAESLFDSYSFMRELKSFLEDDTIDFVWANGKFDIKFFRHRYGINARVDDDVMLMHYLLDERSGTHDLAFMCKRYLNDVDYEKEMMESLDIKDKGELWKAPRHITHKYVAYDADRPLRLYYILKEKINDCFL